MINNALKFSFAKPIIVLAHYSYEKQILEVHIQDTGQGIHERSRKRLFKLFGKLNNEIAPAGKSNMNEAGVGMGLSIFKKIVERADGKIDVFSRGLRQGSTFMFTMTMPLPHEKVNNLSVIHEAVDREHTYDSSRTMGNDNCPLIFEPKDTLETNRKQSELASINSKIGVLQHVYEIEEEKAED